MRKIAVACLLPVAGLALLLIACSSKPDPEVEIAGIPLTEVLAGIVQRTNLVMGDIHGIESAKAAREELARLNTDYDDLLYHAARLSPAGRAKLAERAAGYLPELKRIATAIQESPALKPILGAEVQAMLEKHRNLASTTDAAENRR